MTRYTRSFTSGFGTESAPARGKGIGMVLNLRCVWSKVALSCAEEADTTQSTQLLMRWFWGHCVWKCAAFTSHTTVVLASPGGTGRELARRPRRHRVGGWLALPLKGAASCRYRFALFPMQTHTLHQWLEPDHASIWSLLKDPILYGYIQML